MHCKTASGRDAPRRRLGRVLGHVEESSRPGPVEACVRLPLALCVGLGARSRLEPDQPKLTKPNSIPAPSVEGNCCSAGPGSSQHAREELGSRQLN